MQKGKAAVAPTQRKANILIEAFGDLKILSRDMRLEFNSIEAWHTVALLQRIGSGVKLRANSASNIPKGAARGRAA